MTKKGNLQQGAFHLEKGKKLEWLMAVILLAAAYFLSREGARLVAAQKAATKVVVLDSGHGGDDPGKIGVNGVKEKDINLSIARLLKKKLEKQGIFVVMTRAGEEDLSDPGAVNAKVQDLQRRVQLIHEKAPDCVISIHQNSYPDAAVKGAQVFYYTDSKEGEKLALCMQNALVAGLDPENHRKAKGNKTYYMLKKTDAVLVICECGFLSNPEEEALLNTKEYQKKVADALCAGVLAYMGEKDHDKEETQTKTEKTAARSFPAAACGTGSVSGARGI